ncbi:mitochondrial 54S ribosomal protein YmL23 [Pyronema domesticum]|uniref:Large ribosomal subunit protein uL13m n=1 Tax=Pyronema omphalodes (strain CBS 100304) TaxID=1076935 RepID=U4LJ28_PYROM|nr:mitochondrial 54S ribosomal protein YmL23 [Pyronema domesticum]CCX31572.1 Similar to 54S ribosomal protein L23, mitochondrial; acc. no. Q12487 [Pyronema omphalodes CBS 100304]
MSQNIGRTSLAYARSWHLIDMASDQRSLGRIATQIAITLMGKHKPIFNPSTDCGDYVVAVGCHDLHTTGKKKEKKKYYSHSTRPGRLQEITMERMMAKYGGGEVLKKAVSGMLPKNRLREIRLARLRVFEGPGHPYKENIVKINDATVRESTTPVMDAVKELERSKEATA